MNKEETSTGWRRADDNIKKAQARIRDQELRIRRLAAVGYPTAAAEKVLENLNNSVRLLQDIRVLFGTLSEQ